MFTIDHSRRSGPPRRKLLDRLGRRAARSFTVLGGASMLLAAAGCADDGPQTSPIGGPADGSEEPEGQPDEQIRAEFRTPWLTPNGSYSNERVADSMIDSSNVDELALAWSAPIEAPSGMAGIPIVDDQGTVYVQDFNSDVIAYDLDTGEQRWKAVYGVQTFGPNGVAYEDGALFGVTGSEVFSLDAATGDERWRAAELDQPVGLAEGATLGFTIQPTVRDGVVYLSEAAKSGGGDLLVLDASDGSELWRFDTTDEPEGDLTPSGGAWSAPAIDAEGYVYYGTGNGYYSHNAPAEHQNERLYTNSALKLDAATGELDWFFQAVPNDFWDWDLQLSPILADVEGRPMAIVGGKMGFVYGLDSETGELLWKTSVGTHNGHDDDGQAQLDGTLELPPTPFEVFPGTLGGVETNMAYRDGIVYAAVVNMSSLVASDEELSNPVPPTDTSEGTGTIVAIHAATGEIAWSHDIDQIPFGSMTISNDLVFTTTYDGMLRAYHLDDGTEAWAGELPAGSNATPTIVGNTIVVAAGVPHEDEQTAQLVAFRLGAIPIEMPTASADSGSKEGGTEGAVEVGVIEGENKFDTEELTVEAGTVTFRFTNTETMGHNFAIRIDGEVTDRTAIISDDVVELTVELEPGEYEFICEPHVNLGMRGTLIVTD